MIGRKEPRFIDKRNIILRDRNRSFPAMMINASHSGLAVKSEYVFPTYKEIDILINLNEKIITLKGCIRWIMAAKHHQENNFKQIGILLRSYPPEFSAYIDSISEN
jgi:Tfp pilus assembly protein PilZ